MPLQFAFLYDGQEIFVWSDCLLDLGTDFLYGNMAFVWNVLYLALAPHFHDLFSSLQLCCEGPRFKSIREHISCTLDLREINPVYAVVVCGIQESISGLEPLSVTTELRYLKLVTVSSICPFTFISVFMPLVLFVIMIFSVLTSMP